MTNWKPSGHNNFGTPQWILKIFNGWFDPCPYDESPFFDGLKIDWGDKTFCNPPYTYTSQWVVKAIEENRKGKTIVLLLRLDCSTKWFRKLIDAKAHILFINERVKFEHLDGTNTARFPSFLAILEGSNMEVYLKGSDNIASHNLEKSK
jgi:hypothetical protein